MMPQLTELPAELFYAIMDHLSMTRRTLPAGANIPIQQNVTNRKTGTREIKILFVETYVALQHASLESHINHDRDMTDFQNIGVIQSFKPRVQKYLQAYLKPTIPGHTTERFRLEFINMAVTSQFLSNLNHVALYCITTIQCHWENVGFFFPPPNQQHVTDDAAPAVFTLLAQKCVNLRCLIVKVNLQELSTYHANGAERLPHIAFNAIPGIRELRALKRLVEQRAGNYVELIELQRRRQSLDSLMR